MKNTAPKTPSRFESALESLGQLYRRGVSATRRGVGMTAMGAASLALVNCGDGHGGGGSDKPDAGGMVDAGGGGNGGMMEGDGGSAGENGGGEDCEDRKLNPSDWLGFKHINNTGSVVVENDNSPYDGFRFEVPERGTFDGPFTTLVSPAAGIFPPESEGYRVLIAGNETEMGSSEQVLRGVDVTVVPQEQPYKEDADGFCVLNAMQPEKTVESFFPERGASVFHCPDGSSGNDECEVADSQYDESGTNVETESLSALYITDSSPEVMGEGDAELLGDGRLAIRLNGRDEGMDIAEVSGLVSVTANGVPCSYDSELGAWVTQGAMGTMEGDIDVEIRGANYQVQNQDKKIIRVKLPEGMNGGGGAGGQGGNGGGGMGGEPVGGGGGGMDNLGETDMTDTDTFEETDGGTDVTDTETDTETETETEPTETDGGTDVTDTDIEPEPSPEPEVPVDLCEGVVCEAEAECVEAEACDSETGMCVGGEPKAVAEACDDGNERTIGDMCDGAGACEGAQVECLEDVECADGNMCNGEEACDADGACMAGTPVMVTDSNACTVDSCDPIMGVSHVAMGVDDSNACTVDSCDQMNGVSHAPLVCESNNQCLTDSCDPTGGCQTTSRTGLSCDDGYGQTSGEMCNAGDQCESPDVSVDVALSQGGYTGGEIGSVILSSTNAVNCSTNLVGASWTAGAPGNACSGTWPFMVTGQTDTFVTVSTTGSTPNNPSTSSVGNSDNDSDSSQIF